MKRTTVREIYIEIETIRVTKKRSGRAKTPAPPKTETVDCTNTMIKTNAQLESFFKRIL